jgi:predicted DNA-binding transcriptional regulator YafY
MTTRTCKANKPAASNRAASTPREGNTRRPMQRIFEIHSEIRKGELPNCSTLAASLGVTRKTIQRDINFMRDGLGLPLVYCDDLHGYRYDGDVLDFPMFAVSEKGAGNLVF